jgi:VanZ family protein
MAIKEKNKNNLIITILAYLMVVVIFGNSLLPGDISSSQSGFFSGLIKDILAFLGLNIQDDMISFFVRKLAHFTEFFVLGVLWTFVFMRRYERYVLITILFGMCIAGIDEFIQYFVPGRAMMFTDFLIDVLGVAVGTLFVQVIYKGKKEEI